MDTEPVDFPDDPQPGERREEPVGQNVSPELERLEIEVKQS